MSAERLLKFPDRDFNTLTSVLEEISDLHLENPKLQEGSSLTPRSADVQVLEYDLLSDLKTLIKTKQPISASMLVSLNTGLDMIAEKESKYTSLFRQAIQDLVTTFNK